MVDNQEDIEAPDFNWKVILVGNKMVGKTSITTRHVDNTFEEEYKTTTQVQWSRKLAKISGTDKHAQLHIWDTLGQEKFKALAPLFFRKSVGAFLVYDVTNEDSFLALKTWHEQVAKHADGKIVYMLLGNKVDKPGKVVTTDMGNAWAAEMGFGFMEVSAKTGLGIQAAFEAIVTQMHSSATAGRG